MSATVVDKGFLPVGLIAALCCLTLLASCQSTPPARSHMTLDTAVLESLVEPVQPVPYAGGNVIAPGVEIPDPDLWMDIRRGFHLDRHTDEKRVRQELNWLTRHPAYLKNMQPRLARHLAYIHEQVTTRGLPSELTLLPIVESALDPYAFSHGGAAGLWQFIPATAKRFGLERNWWYDGRRDPVSSTDAALDYLSRLHARFGDWYLALAGYNAGEGNVLHAVRRASPGANFFDLKLPRETSAYVPRLLALAELVANPDAYGVELPPLGPDVPFTVVDTGSQMDLAVASAATGVDLDTLYLWNPALNQWSTPPKGPHHLLFPLDTVDAAARITSIPESERVRWLRITVRPGDTLSEIAHRHRTDIASLKQANRLRNNRITAGDSLLIPKSPAALSNTILSRNQGTTYVVQSGDSLWTISRAHGIPMNTLMKLNQVGPKDYLRVGQQLTLPDTARSAPMPMQTAREAQIRKVRYGVRRGDSLARIAAKFNVRIKDIVSWNNLDIGRYLQPGQVLLLYVNVSAPSGAD
jgi:membrane-bound lytic murein transglycosylase D